MALHKLTELKIRSLKPRDDRARLIGDGDRLYLRIYPSGRKTWMLRDASGNRQRHKTLGEYPDLTLRDARLLAQAGAKTTAVLFGKTTVAQLSKDFFESQIAPRHKQPMQVKLYLDRDLLPIASRKVVDVTRADLAGLLRRRAAAGTPVAANRLLAVLRQMFRYAVRSGVLDNDPSALLDRSLAGGTEKPRERVLTDDEIRKLWHTETENQPLFRWLLASGQRIGEAQTTRWRDIRDGKWHIPENKAGRPHWCSISSVMHDVLHALPKGKPEDKVFRQVTKTGVQVWVRRWCEREQIESRFTPHDFRRTCATRMNEIGVAPHIVERVLNHRMVGVMAVYNRAEFEKERIEGQDKWASELKRLCNIDRASGGQKHERPKLRKR